MKKRANSGRPPKFDEESRPITVTLPKSILDKLQTIDNDRAKAIVKCVTSLDKESWPKEKGVEVVEFCEGTGLIVINYSKYLKTLPWLQLIEISPFKYLIAIPSGTSIETFELALIDLLENIPPEETDEKALLTELRQKIGHHRREDNVSKGEILYINTR